nr:MAG TPA: hypothetical protein [Caudoviricetes sp.]
MDILNIPIDIIKRYKASTATYYGIHSLYKIQSVNGHT